MNLTPMKGGIAQVVPPNTWRVIGDRVRDDEAYIPINRSGRSQRIFEETARRMGYSVARMYATGGLAATAQQARTVVTAARLQQATTGGDGAAIVARLDALRKEIASIQPSKS